MSEIINKDPMALGKIIDKSVKFIFNNIVWITVVGFGISLLELSLDHLRVSLEQWKPNAGESIPFEILQYGPILILIYMILNHLLKGTVTLLFGEEFLGRNMSFYQGFQKSIKKLIPLILLQLAVAIVIGLGSILFIIPGIIAMCATACAIPAMMLEDLGPMKAFDRSWDLTKNNRFRIFALSCLLMLIMFLLHRIPSWVTIVIPMDPIYKVVFSAIILAPFKALWAAINTLLFLDLRIRKEAIDLEKETNTISLVVEKAT